MNMIIREIVSTFHSHCGLLDITAMLFKPFLLFGVLAALISTAIARHPRIKFCDHKGSDACITEQMEIGVCKALPDSNNKGDGGSTFEVRHVRSRLS